MGPEARLRPAWAEIDLAALEANAALVRELVAPAALCAVVKADGYGHGAVAAARAALAGGATWLAVALVEEGLALRRAGVDAPVMVLSEAPQGALAPALDAGLTLTVYSDAALDAVERVATACRRAAAVQVKLDTGLHRVGASPAVADRLVRRLAAGETPRLAGVWTHLAFGATPNHPFNAEQVGRLCAFVDQLHADGIDPGLVHAANSGAALLPFARLDLVRAGLALYGYSPVGAEDAGPYSGLRPVLSLKAYASAAVRREAGEACSYGLLRPLPTAATVLTVPLGYADGVPWRLFPAAVPVLVGGERRPLAGAVTMDQLLVDAGDLPTSVGSEVVLLGHQGGGAIWADEWAEMLGTIPYEVLCAIGGRVPRVEVGLEDPEPAPAPPEVAAPSLGSRGAPGARSARPHAGSRGAS